MTLKQLIQTSNMISANVLDHLWVCRHQTCRHQDQGTPGQIKRVNRTKCPENACTGETKKNVAHISRLIVILCVQLCIDERKTDRSMSLHNPPVEKASATSQAWQRAKALSSQFAHLICFDDESLLKSCFIQVIKGKCSIFPKEVGMADLAPKPAHKQLTSRRDVFVECGTGT